MEEVLSLWRLQTEVGSMPGKIPKGKYSKITYFLDKVVPLSQLP